EIGLRDVVPAGRANADLDRTVSRERPLRFNLRLRLSRPGARLRRSEALVAPEYHLVILRLFTDVLHVGGNLDVRCDQPAGHWNDRPVQRGLAAEVDVFEP